MVNAKQISCAVLIVWIMAVAQAVPPKKKMTTEIPESLILYGPLEPWFDKTWRPGKIELIKK